VQLIQSAEVTCSDDYLRLRSGGHQEWGGKRSNLSYSTHYLRSIIPGWAHNFPNTFKESFPFWFLGVNHVIHVMSRKKLRDDTSSMSTRHLQIVLSHAVRDTVARIWPKQTVALNSHLQRVGGIGACSNVLNSSLENDVSHQLLLKILGNFRQIQRLVRPPATGKDNVVVNNSWPKLKAVLVSAWFWGNLD
jgi:hypothetical protein